MPSNQEARHASVRAVTGTTYDYNGDWVALFDSRSVPAGDFNGRMLAWLNTALGSSYPDVQGAMNAAGLAMGVVDWDASDGANILTQAGNCLGASWDTTFQASFWSTAAPSADVSAPGVGTVNKFVAGATTNLLFARKAQTFVSGKIHTVMAAIYVPTQAGVTNWAFSADFQDVETVASSAITTLDRWVFVRLVAPVLASNRTRIDFNIIQNGAIPSAGFTFYTSVMQVWPVS